MPIFIDDTVTTQIVIHKSTSNPPIDSNYMESKKRFLLRSKLELELCSHYLKTPLSKNTCLKMLMDIDIHLQILLLDVNRIDMHRIFIYLRHSIKGRSIVTIALVTLIPFLKYIKIFHIQPYLLFAKLRRVIT